MGGKQLRASSWFLACRVLTDVPFALIDCLCNLLSLGKLGGWHDARKMFELEHFVHRWARRREPADRFEQAEAL
eukprot:2654897-Prymnesium_polylepis.1